MSERGDDMEKGILPPRYDEDSELPSAEQSSNFQQHYGAADTVPPRYEESNFQTSDPPPSYDSLYGKIKATHQESSSFFDFFKKFLIIILGTIGCTICVALLLAIPISMIAIGSIYLYDCPRERFIPIYLIVAGCFGVVKNLSDIIQRIKNRHDNNDDRNAKPNPFDGVVNCFLVIWFIAGNVWIYRIYGNFHSTPAPGLDPDPEYCNPILYYFAFWITTSIYILLLVTCCFVCLGGTVVSALSPTSTPR